MSEGPKVKGNPLRLSVYLLVASYIVGEFILPKYLLIYPINLTTGKGAGTCSYAWCAGPGTDDEITKGKEVAKASEWKQ